MFKKKNQTSVNTEDLDDLILIEDLGHSANLEQADKKNRKKRRTNVPKIIFRLLFIFASCYLIAVYSHNAFISKWRTLYIETAMGTMTHQWLATAFIPGSVIDEVMADVNANRAAQQNLESTWGNSSTADKDDNQSAAETENDGDQIIYSDVEEETEEKTPEEEFYETFWEVDTEEFREFLAEHPEYLENGYENLDIEDLSKDYDLKTVNDDTVMAVDAVNNLLLIEIKTYEYVGKLAIIKNSSQVDLAKCNDLGGWGDPIWVFGEDNDCMIAINASRFTDEGGHGTGGIVAGSLVIDGVDYGRPHKKDWKFFGMKYDNLFYITNYANADVSEYRWAVECYPALVVDGENVVDGSFGMGIQPRTTIGQTQNGDFMALVVDGRQAGYSVGCTIAECADIMIRYGCYQGADLDGGSSSVLWYKGSLITKSCSANKNGRYTPDAIIFRYADDPDVILQDAAQSSTR